MYNTIFKINLEDHNIDVSDFDERNYSYVRGPLDTIMLDVVLFKKYNLVAYNISVTPGTYKSASVHYDFCGKLEDMRNYHDDYAENSAFYKKEIMKIVNSIPKGSAPKLADLLANTPHVHSSSEFL